VRHTYKVT